MISSKTVSRLTYLPTELSHIKLALRLEKEVENRTVIIHD